MPSDLDVYRSASVLIDHHGADALFEAAQRADAFLAQGDLDGYNLWTRIAVAIQRIQANKPLDGEATH